MVARAFDSSDFLCQKPSDTREGHGACVSVCVCVCVCVCGGNDGWGKEYTYHYLFIGMCKSSPHLEKASLKQRSPRT